MPTAGLLKPNTYRDSVALMVLTSTLSELDGVAQASAVMGTPANLEILAATGLLDPAFAGARPNDLLIAVEARDEAALRAALTAAEAWLAAGPARAGGVAGDGSAGAGPGRPRSLRSAVQARPDANLALISVPGEHATLEAFAALAAGLHVFLFSDNVPLADEAALKRHAAERGLLLMGPDCGTALIGGAPLGFANAVRRGPIGVVGSSGTGLQEVTSLIHRLGGGVSHALGTGGRDLAAEVGGVTFLAAVDALAADPETCVLVAIAKPGDPGVETAVLERLTRIGKPAVVYFLGGATPSAAAPAERRAGAQQADGRAPSAGSLVVAADLEHAARCALALAAGEPPAPPPDRAEADRLARALVAGLGARQRAVRGLFAGGTLAQEAAAAVARALGTAALVQGEARPGEVLRIGPHSILDLGDDAYTRGRPHPLIDPRLRNAALVEQAASGEAALILLDVILGTGAHPDPAGALAPALDAARSAAEAAGARLQVVASLCGTEDDPQGFERQRAALTVSGVHVAASSSEAAVVAARVAALLGEGAR